jgi:hypothetical protein
MNDAHIIDHRGDSPHHGEANRDGDEPILHHVGSPSTAPDGQDARADRDRGAAGREAPAGSGAAEPQTLILAPWRPHAQPSAAIKSSRRLRLEVIAVIAAAAALTASAVTAGVSYLTGSRPAPAPTYAASDYEALSAALGRVDRELTVLKAKVGGIAKATSQPAAKTHDRMERSEKAPSESGTKPARNSDLIDRTERRLATSAGYGPSADSRPLVAAAPVMAVESRSSVPVVEGWTVRDVYNGAALIQSRGGMIQVYPGDYILGLGRIEQLKRQEGHWVVVTSRGLIASH